MNSVRMIGVVHVGIWTVPNMKFGFVLYVLIASMASRVKTQMLKVLLTTACEKNESIIH